MKSPFLCVQNAKCSKNIFFMLCVKKRRLKRKLIIPEYHNTRVLLGLLILKKIMEQIQIHENFQTVQKSIFKNNLKNYENEFFEAKRII